MTRLHVHQPSPHDGILTFKDYGGPVSDSCDVAVVGSGPGGAVVAKELAEAGLKVILLEEGPPFGPADFRQDGGRSMLRMVRGGGTRVAKGDSYKPTMQAKAVGGTSVMNSGIFMRAPAFTLDSWRAKTGIGLTRAKLDPHYEKVERFIGSGPTPHEVLGERNLRFKRGCDALGISSEPTPRNVRGCRGSGECFTGCRHGAKQSVDVSYVPAAISAGARVYSCVRADYLVHEGDRVTGVDGRVVEPFTGRATHRVQIDARIVVLAAGCMQTPVILQKSMLDGGWVGEDLQFHPGLAIMAEYEDRIDPWNGATQGYHSMHYIEEGLKLEVLWAPPEILAARLPGIGRDFQRNLLRFGHYAPFDVFSAANRSRGRVRAPFFGHEPDIRYRLHQDDMDLLMRGMGYLSDIAWASGAVGVLPGIRGLPEVLRSKEESEVLRTTRVSSKDAVVASNHAFGTTRMSKLPEHGVVDEHGEHHQVRGLYVADTGIFAGSPGMNPMLTVMALADRIAQGIAYRYL